MNKRLIITAVVTAVMVLASGSACSLFGSRDDNTTSTGVTSEGTELKKVFSTDAPVDQWDIPIPFVNPLGRQSDYEKTGHRSGEREGFIYLDEDYQEVRRPVAGDLWLLSITTEEEPEVLFEGFQRYIYDLGGTIYFTPHESRVIFSVEDSDGAQWWGEAREHGELELSFVKEVHLQIDEPMTVNTADFPDGKFFFAATHSGAKFQTLTVTLLGGELRLTAETEYRRGVYSRSVDYRQHLYAYKSNVYTLDGIPQETGNVIWEVQWNEGTDPVEITFLLEEVADIDPVKFGEGIGALRVRGVPYGSVRVEPAQGAQVSRHPKLDYEYEVGDMTPEGDTLFWLPSGYWNVYVRLPDDAGLENVKNRLVPVNEGEITVLDMPGELKTVFAAEPLEADAIAESGLEIVETKEMGDRASITFILLDPTKRDMLPSIEETQIFEGGDLVEIEQIERLKIPPSVVLLLDSSGSMRGQMQQTIEAAHQFIDGLPDNSFIQVIDFDSEITALKGTTKAEAIEALAQISADGATTLFDSIIQGIGVLEGRQRPTIVVFTDGVDSRITHPGTGSEATLEQVLTAVDEANIPLFTIGFGPDHDNSTLVELAETSDGRYYPAQDQSALDNVFAAINNKLGNTFEATYQRPQRAALGEVPVVSLVIDTSGSMDSDPAEEGSGWRIQKVKNLFHDFILGLPESVQVQIMEFNYDIAIEQVMSSGKAELLQALGELRAGGGTDILGSAEAAFETLKPVPSTKKVIIYVTDAALEVDQSDQGVFEDLLQQIKAENIQVLWVGLGLEGEEDAFAWAAEQSGGRYVISEDAAVLADAFTGIIEGIKQMPASDKTALTLNITKRSDDGAPVSYSASELVVFPPRPSSTEQVALETMRYQTGIPLQHYDKSAAELLYGSNSPDEDVELTRRIPLNVEGENQAMKLSTVEAFFLNRLRGVDAPSGRRYLAIEMEMKNILPEQEVVVYPDGSGHPANWVGTGSSGGQKMVTRIPYLVPSMTSHFFVTINNEGSYPASQATWLAEKPITPPGENGLMINPEDTVRGIMIFEVPKEPMQQAALNFYDTSYGHISLPLVGKMDTSEESLEALPKTAPVKISDAFSMAIKAFNDLEEIQMVQASEGSTFRVLEAQFTANVQALLDIDPSERFLLQLHTDKGPFQVRLSPVTGGIPYGFIKPVMLAPGSVNKARLVYQIPEALKNAGIELFGDTRGEHFIVPISGSKARSSRNVAGRFAGEGIELVVNSLSQSDKVAGYYDSWVVVDITVVDEKDGFATRGFADAFYLVREDHGQSGGEGSGEAEEHKGLGNFASTGGSSDTLLEPEDLTNDLLLGAADDFIVYDGERRRGFILFRLPDDADEYQWTLQSPYFQTLMLPLAGAEFTEDDLLVTRVDVTIDDDYEEQLAEAISTAIRNYEARQAANPELAVVNKVGLGSTEEQRNYVPVPITASYGLNALSDIDTMAEFVKTMEGLAWLPSEDPGRRYAPEAVLTQGWGNQYDLANLAKGLLSAMGYRPSIRMVKVTEQGLQALGELSKSDNANTELLPALKYQDERGEGHVFVIPFMKEINQLSGLVYMPLDQPRVYEEADEAVLTVEFMLEPTVKSQLNQLRDIGDILAGGSGEGDSVVAFTVFEGYLPLDSLSLDAIDIGYAAVGANTYTVVIDTQAGRMVGQETIDTRLYNIVGSKITVEFPQGSELVHHTRLAEEEEISGVFHTLGVNLPDIPEAAVEALQAAADERYKQAENPSDLATLRWYNRNILNRFIAAQTAYEKDLADDLGLTTGRTEKGRLIVVTVQRKDAASRLRTSIDLVQVINQVHRGSEEAVNAFNIMSGMYASRLESSVLPGSGLGLFTIWEESPDDTRVILISDETRSADVDYMREKEYPKFLIDYIENCEKIVLIPSKPSLIQGEEHWAWLEIDPRTYETIAVLETGERGAMTETVMQHAIGWESYRDYMAGALIGVDVSLWSVSAFALELEDYEEILEEAKKFALSLGERLSGFLDMKDNASSPSVDLGSAGPLQLGFDGELDASADLLGFGNGFNDGVAFYFDKAGN